MRSKLAKGMLIIFSANLVSLCFNMLINFIVPKHLTVDSYAAIKTYQLYTTYVGVLHFGYNDGMYLKYGGKTLSDIRDGELAEGVSVIRTFQIGILILGAIFSLSAGNYILLMVSLAMLPINMLSYFQFLYQACGEFKIYSRFMATVSAGTLLINAALIYLFRTNDYIIFLISYVALNMVVWLSAEAIFHHLAHSRPRLIYFSLPRLLEGIKGGILLMLGNFSSIIMTTMDQFFVNGFIGTRAFAQYSFAVSMETFLSVATTPITVTLYNHFCIHDTPGGNRSIRQKVIILASLIIAAAFPVKFIMEHYLTEYMDAVTVLFLLFAAHLFYVVIRGVYVNLYKARRQQRRYFTGLIVVIAFGLAANIAAYFISGAKEGFAVATLLSAVFWLFVCRGDFKDMHIQEYAYMFIQLALFLGCGIFLGSVSGGILYLLGTALSAVIFMRPALRLHQPS